ncbi:MAG: internalization-related competence protein ComEC/Rec2 protein [Candidatus Jorgensenbacteria bacterium GW2011_GWA1_48_13]|uniref:Internalization-related competence protein ComEC/Rec2 protein n=2 Tax=Candidatus Joergenseniibacteriota TaxID=1752739 RepID=A0A0G1Z8W8_9BACT|nr:MAG: internalization-related competence protein ComEC/Rec2 protein [Candidatus Jorgensenbacteria bacterium GW2011_GWA1_48_13]KKU99091.1 MAG: internalization-related competence protein ComEC/Rec2 protein [Candidatus Jorgensenbacteria bacterium GW2011_GWC1_48_8]KKW15499.1 MAG: internalization-related competence protein ComEC/Rec2 protein [Candidatus Jorgensenbacteria bacterium GW2011_GWB1_50_10]
MWEKLAEHKNKIIVLLAALAILDFLVFWQIGRAGTEDENLRIYFLSVGQGDSELVELPGGVKVLIDGGPPNGLVSGELSKFLPMGDRYVDLVVMSHPQLDHFGGLIEILRNYEIGAFLTSGREGEAAAFAELEQVIEEKNIKVITLSAGDRIRYLDSRFEILSPEPADLKSRELNDATLVMELTNGAAKALFTGDIGADIEEKIFWKLENIDILKVPHHGSKFSSSEKFLAAIKPAVAVVEVGKNSYGHPTKEALDRVSSVGARIFRTDLDGTLRFELSDKEIRIFQQR